MCNPQIGVNFRHRNAKFRIRFDQLMDQVTTFYNAFASCAVELVATKDDAHKTAVIKEGTLYLKTLQLWHVLASRLYKLR